MMTILTNVVFTGAAQDEHGRSVLRADLKEWAEGQGFKVQSAVTNATQMLIASRDDTVKAKKAKAKGIEVRTYPEFIASLQGRPMRTQRMDPWVDLPKSGTPMQLSLALDDSEDLM